MLETIFRGVFDTQLTNTITPQGLGRTLDERVANLVGILDAGFVPDDCAEI